MDIISLFTEQYNERDVEIGLVKHVEKFLVEMGAGFAFMGRQYHIEVSGDDYYIDILMYNTFPHRYLVIELKDTEFMPEYIGKLNFYCSAKAKTASRLNTPCVTFRGRSGYLTMNWDKPCRKTFGAVCPLLKKLRKSGRQNEKILILIFMLCIVGCSL